MRIDVYLENAVSVEVADPTDRQAIRDAARTKFLALLRGDGWDISVAPIPEPQLPEASQVQWRRIWAEANTADAMHQIAFDVTDWFAQAGDEALETLAKAGWGGEAAAAVAKWCNGKQETITRLFAHLDRIKDQPSYPNGGGFECVVDRDSAIAWLAQHKRRRLPECGNCDWVGLAGEMPCVGNQIPDVWLRIEAGGVMPTGECPACGALAYPLESNDAEPEEVPPA